MHIELLIGGKAVNPATQEVPTEVNADVAAAKDAFPAWAGLPAPERAKLVRKLGDLIAKETPELAQTEIFCEILQEHAAKGYSEGFMHDTAMLMGSLGRAEVVTPYFGVSETGQLNAIFPVTQQTDRSIPATQASPANGYPFVLEPAPCPI